MFHLLKGWLGEAGVKIGLRTGLDQELYRSFHNLIVPTTGGTTQIDHVVVSKFGVFVIETKTFKGWIFGSAEDRTWCQSIYGRKYQFQNPIHQNYRHLKCLEEYLGIPKKTLRPVVLFPTDCQFKTQMPANVLNSGLRSHILGFQQICLTGAELAEIFRKFEALLANPSLTKQEHLKSLAARHNSTTTCPKCGSALITRTAKKGRSVGSKFLGCSRYPRCKFTRQMPSSSPASKAPSDESLFERFWRFLLGE